MELAAYSARLENDGYCTVLAFADSEDEPQNYAILQMTNTPSPQDVKLGQDGLHFELAGQCGPESGYRQDYSNQIGSKVY